MFWDTHDTTAFEDEFDAIDDVRFVISPGRPNKAITVRLAEKTLHELVELAQEHGIGASTLVRMWILQRLYDLQGGSPGTGAKG